jgi:RNA polymerase sigma factor (sigma-70 family)
MSEILSAFLQNEKAIRRYVTRLCPGRHDVEDLVQEVFLRGFAAETKGGIREPKAFLFKIAKNLTLTDKRKSMQESTGPLEDLVGAELIVDERQVTADELLDGRRKLALFALAVANLPPQCRKAFLLRRVEGLTYKQIANRMDISVSAVEKHVTNGLLKCNAYLRASGYVSSEIGAAPTPQEEVGAQARRVIIRAERRDDRD